MKTVKSTLSSLLTAICSIFLSILGFGCSSDPSDMIVMYGQPNGDFEIKGSVTDEAGTDVADAEIRVTTPDTPSGIHSLQTTTTNADGKYVAEGKTSGYSRLKVVCLPSDPTLEADSVIVKLNYNKDNASSWYKGEAKETVDFKLSSKPSTKK